MRTYYHKTADIQLAKRLAKKRTLEIVRCNQEIEQCHAAACDPNLSPKQQLGAIAGEVEWTIAKQMAEEAEKG